jgi:hypothetical protein
MATNPYNQPGAVSSGGLKTYNKKDVKAGKINPYNTSFSDTDPYEEQKKRQEADNAKQSKQRATDLAGKTVTAQAAADKQNAPKNLLQKTGSVISSGAKGTVNLAKGVVEDTKKASVTLGTGIARTLPGGTADIEAEQRASEQASKDMARVKDLQKNKKINNEQAAKLLKNTASASSDASKGLSEINKKLPSENELKGSMLELGSFAVPGGGVEKLGSKLLPKLAAKVAVKKAESGAGGAAVRAALRASREAPMGATYGAGNAMTEDKNVIKGAAEGAALVGAGGAGASLIRSGAKGVKSLKPDIPAAKQVVAKQNLEQLAETAKGRMKIGGQVVKEANTTHIPVQQPVPPPTVNAVVHPELLEGKIVKPEIATVPHKNLTLGSDTLHTKLDKQTIAKYVDDINAGRPVSPVVISREKGGQILVHDGKHRLAAMKQAGVENIPVVEKTPLVKRAEAQAPQETLLKDTKQIEDSASKKYKTVHAGGEIKVVDGEPVKIVDGVDTFVHQGDGGWVVSEASTGRFLAESRMKGAAVAKARANINEAGIDKFKQLIKDKKLNPAEKEITQPSAVSAAHGKKDPLTALKQEALKYKSADEFVKAQGTPLYHGTNAKFDTFDNSKIGSTTDDGMYGRGHYFSNDSSYAQQAPKGAGAHNVMEVRANLKNPLDLSKFKTKQELADYLDMSEQALTQDEGGFVRPLNNQIGQFTSQAKELGHDGVLVPYSKHGAVGDETVVFDAKNIKTKQQLTDLYNQARAEAKTNSAQISKQGAPTISELGGGRQADDIQRQIEAAHNAGDTAAVNKLIPQLPKDLQESTRSAMEALSPPATKIPVTAAPKAAVATPPLKPIGEGATKTSKLGASVQQKAIDKKLTEKLGELPEYSSVNMKEQAAHAIELLASDEAKAIRIARGLEAPPSNILPESVYTAVENKALADGNVDLLIQLAQSTRVGEATAMGQRIRALAERDPDSAVTHIRQVAEARQAALEKQTKTSVAKSVQKTASEIKRNIKEPTKTDWNMFVESLKC